MKPKIQKINTQTAALLTAALFGLISPARAQNVSISPTGNAPDNSAALDIRDFTDKGLLIPRIALTSPTDAVTIPNPATSLLVYNTNTAGGLTPGYYYNAGTPSSPNWVRLLNGGSPSDAWLTLGNAGTNSATHFVGTTDNVDLVFRTNNTEKMRITAGGNVGIGTTAPNYNLHVNNQLGVGIAGSTSGQIGIFPPNGGSWFWIDNDGNNYLRFSNGVTPGGNPVVITSAGNVGIGTTSPTAKLHVNGTFRYTDGTEGAGKVLTSDAAGNASWQTPSASLNINWITPVQVFSMGSGHHSNCTLWYVNDPICGCGYVYDPWWDDCIWTGATTTTPNSCCAQIASYPTNTTNYSWQTINISSYVPPGTKNVLIEVDYAIATPDNGDVDAFVLVRANSSSPTMPIARGRSAGKGDNVAGLNTAIIPIDQSTLTFQLAVEVPGFDGGVTVRLLAYF